jgi:hypothetical protein
LDLVLLIVYCFRDLALEINEDFDFF